MKVIVDIVLDGNLDKQGLLGSLDPAKVELWNIMESIPNIIVLSVEEDHIEALKKDGRIISAEQRIFKPCPADIPDFYSMTKTITAITPSTSQDGRSFAPMQFYLDTDIIYSSQKLGTNDQIPVLNDANYFSRWTGKHVDIVTLEVGPVESGLQGIHDTHPDFRDPDDLGTSRIIAKNWVDLEDASNNQVSTDQVLSSHGMGVLSAAAGTICGFAKKANLYAVYLTAEDGEVECINAIVSWHNSKPINPETGLPNPTIHIAEYQYLADRYTGINIDDIASITDQDQTITKPISGWGTDFTAFTSRNIIPFKILDPDTSVWTWCVVFPFQGTFSAIRTAYNAAWDAGIVNVNAAGNNGGVYVKDSDPRFAGVYCTKVSGSSTRYDIRRSVPGAATIVSKSTTAVSIWYPFIAYGPHGIDKAIDVAAGQNSETYQILDPYSNRGPGIDIVGLGQDTWTAYPLQTFADGNKWGMFSGTSCATPTVVGKMACMMERYFTYNRVWPTPSQIKEILLSESPSVVTGVDSTTWNDVPSASTNYSVNEFSGTTNFVNHIENNFSSPNGGFRLAELAGTSRKRSFLNAQSFDRKYTKGKRPQTGMVYPRTRIKRK